MARGVDVRRRRRNRRAIVREGADPRQAAIGRTSHGRTNQQEGKGKEQADSGHFDALQYFPAALGASFVGGLITISHFRSSAPKAKNGFVAAWFVSSPAGRRNNQQPTM